MGILEFIFGKGAPKDDTAPKQAFYLNDDDAKSFGNIEYMRSAKTVKRTFAKKKGEEKHLESVRQISAMSAAEIADNNGGFTSNQSSFATISTPASSASSSASSSPAPASAAKPRRKPAGSDMDMFRNMAKEIKK
ncbi:MAG: Gammaherpesvirus capsid protein [Phormidesmis priestleyi Ana]|uniref:Gammaherpesvirus capsid protein n=1 Tax=Phormidesmis priestleyi Ana TaxID=1666911 RepID=A0A0N8KNN8_9CYAN|nr:MAG: Gammaherpesvirus capsid protein [Phormidesmis priestleyi Ana]